MTGTGDTVRRPVVLTTDCGTEMDDQWALTHLFLSPTLELRAVVSTHAPNLPPPAAEASAAHCRDVLARLPGGTSVTVLAGSSEPLPAPGKTLPNPGVERIVTEARTCRDGRLLLLAIGAATDVASALLLAPDIAERVEIVAMGFQDRNVGGDEWNVKNDPEAWRAILASGAPVTVGDAATCKRHLCLTPRRAAELLGHAGSTGRYLVELLKTWLAANGETARLVTGKPDTWPVWDEIVVAHLLGMTRCVVAPRPSLRDDLSFGPPEDGTMRWVTSVDAEALWSDLALRCSGT